MLAVVGSIGRGGRLVDAGLCKLFDVSVAAVLVSTGTLDDREPATSVGSGTQGTTTGHHPQAPASSLLSALQSE